MVTTLRWPYPSNASATRCLKRRRWMDSPSVFLVACALCGCGSGTVSLGPAGGSPLTSDPAPMVVTADAGAPPATTASLSGQLILLGAQSNAGASVTLEPGNLSAAVDPSGSFFFDQVTPGAVRATASAPGYQSVSQSVTLMAGQPASLSFTLERSRLLLPLPGLAADAGLFLERAQWAETADGGRVPGHALVFGLGGQAWSWLDDGGPTLAASAAGGVLFLGFDDGGSAVLASAGEDGSAMATFLGSAVASAVPLGPAVLSAIRLSQGRLYYPLASAAPLATYLTIGPGEPTPTTIATQVNPAGEVQVEGAIAAWTGAGCEIPYLYGLQLSVPLIDGCAPASGPLTPSLDGSRLGFAVAASATSPFQVVVVSDSTSVFSNALPSGLAVYPLGPTQFAAEDDSTTPATLILGDLDAGLQRLPVLGWAPLAGQQLLAAVANDNGAALQIPGVPGSIAFGHPWSRPLFSPDNRYVVFSGVSSIFDLQRQIEIPLGLSPVWVAFDRAETHALLRDAAGNLALLALSSLAATVIPQGLPLEGNALAASFTADEQGVVYAGTDALGSLGLFWESLDDH